MTEQTQQGAEQESGRQQLAEQVKAMPCPTCGHALRLEWRLKAKPLGTFSVAGVQMKVTASEVPWVVCDGCGVSAEGHR